MFKKNVIGICSFILILILTAVFVNLHFRNLSKSSDDFFGKPVWVFKPQYRIDTSLLDNSRLFIQTLDSIYSLNTQTGEILWQTNLLADPIYGAPMKVNDDILLAQGRNATIMAYSANSGKLLWQNRFTNDYWIEDMGIFDNSLYVARHSTYLTAYNLNDGEILWSQRVPDRTSLFVFPDRETVYLGTSDSLRSYGVKTYDGDYLGPGRLLWEYSLDGLVDYMEKVDDTIYIAYYQDEGISFSAMDIKTFESKWNISYRQIPGILSIRSMVIENDVLYATGDKIVAIATQNGKVLWASERKAAYKKSIISGNVIYAIDRSYLYTLDKNTGVEMGRVPLPGLPSLISFIQGSYTNLFINDDLVIIVSNGQVYCYPRSVL